MIKKAFVVSEFKKFPVIEKVLYLYRVLYNITYFRHIFESKVKGRNELEKSPYSDLNF